MADKILQVKNLKTYFHTEAGLVKAVNDVSFDVEKGKTLGIVGESGCGKSMTSLSIMRLIEKPGQIEGGEILLEGKDIVKMSEDEMRKIRGKKIAMIFQEPMTSLNPVLRIGEQVDEVIALHNPDMTKGELKKASQQALTQARASVGAKRETIKITDREWEAIQAGAISENKLTQIIDNVDIDSLRQRATPRATTTLSTAKQNKIASMNASGYSTSEIAEALGISTSTVSNYLN